MVFGTRLGSWLGLALFAIGETALAGSFFGRNGRLCLVCYGLESRRGLVCEKHNNLLPGLFGDVGRVVFGERMAGAALVSWPFVARRAFCGQMGICRIGV